MKPNWTLQNRNRDRRIVAKDKLPWAHGPLQSLKIESVSTSHCDVIQARNYELVMREQGLSNREKFPRFGSMEHSCGSQLPSFHLIV